MPRAADDEKRITPARQQALAALDAAGTPLTLRRLAYLANVSEQVCSEMVRVGILKRIGREVASPLRRGRRLGSAFVVRAEVAGDSAAPPPMHFDGRPYFGK